MNRTPVFCLPREGRGGVKRWPFFTFRHGVGMEFRFLSVWRSVGGQGPGGADG